MLGVDDLGDDPAALQDASIGSTAWGATCGSAVRAAFLCCVWVLRSPWTCRCRGHVGLVTLCRAQVEQEFRDS